MAMITIEVFTLVLLTLLTIPFVVESNNSLLAETQQGVYVGRQTAYNGTNVN